MRRDERRLHSTWTDSAARSRAAGEQRFVGSQPGVDAGFVTSAAKNGARLDKIMEVTRHKTPAMVLRYVREADAFRDHAGTGFLGGDAARAGIRA